MVAGSETRGSEATEKSDHTVDLSQTDCPRCGERPDEFAGYPGEVGDGRATVAFTCDGCGAPLQLVIQPPTGSDESGTAGAVGVWVEDRRDDRE